MGRLHYQDFVRLVYGASAGLVLHRHKDTLVASERMAVWGREQEKDEISFRWDESAITKNDPYLAISCDKPDELPLVPLDYATKGYSISAEELNSILVDEIKRTIDAHAKLLASTTYKPEPNEDVKEIETIFKGLAKNWKSATAGSSLIYHRFAHPTYHSLLCFAKNNKEEVITLILRELKTNPDWWFEALKFLTNTDPTKKGDNFNSAREAWLNWGKERI
jgi:hypothetical protein